MAAVVCRSDEVVLTLRDTAAYLRWLINLIIQLFLLYDSLNERLGIILIIDGKARRKTQQLRILTQKPQKDGVECAHIDHTGRLFTHHICNPLLHLPGRLVCKGQRQNAVRLISVREDVSYLASENFCLSATRPRNYERWPCKTHNGLFLSLVQPF